MSTLLTVTQNAEQIKNAHEEHYLEKNFLKIKLNTPERLQTRVRRETLNHGTVYRTINVVDTAVIPSFLFNNFPPK